MSESERPQRTWLRFRLRSLMVAVAAFAAWLFAERELFRVAARVVSDLGDGVDYIPHEANVVWVMLNLASIGPLAWIVRTALKLLPGAHDRRKAMSAPDP